MEEINKNDIIYRNIPNISAKGFTGLLTNIDNVLNKKYNYDPESDPIISALDINWCGAEVESNKTINTTDELLLWIKEHTITSEEKQILKDCKNIINALKYILSDSKDENLYWYAGAGPINNSTIPGSDGNWHLITGTPSSIATGELENNTKINWIIAVPTTLGLNHISNGEDITDVFDVIIVTCADGVEYKVFTQLAKTRQIDYNII